VRFVLAQTAKAGQRGNRANPAKQPPKQRPPPGKQAGKKPKGG
jgi:hypothetical protein